MKVIDPYKVLHYKVSDFSYEEQRSDGFYERFGIYVVSSLLYCLDGGNSEPYNRVIVKQFIGQYIEPYFDGGNKNEYYFRGN